MCVWIVSVCETVTHFVTLLQGFWAWASLIVQLRVHLVRSLDSVLVFVSRDLHSALAFTGSCPSWSGVCFVGLWLRRDSPESFFFGFFLTEVFAGHAFVCCGRQARHLGCGGVGAVVTGQRLGFGSHWKWDPQIQRPGILASSLAAFPAAVATLVGSTPNEPVCTCTI